MFYNTRASQRRRKKMFVLYVVFLLVLSVSILLMPISGALKETTGIPMIISGICFWTGLIGTIMAASKINKARKKSYKYRDKQLDGNQFGLISFFKNKEATIADIAMFVFILCFAITRICSDNLYLLFSFLALFVFSFGMHCMLNGKNYNYLNIKFRREESHDLHEKINV